MFATPSCSGLVGGGRLAARITSLIRRCRSGVRPAAAGAGRAGPALGVMLTWFSPSSASLPLLLRADGRADDRVTPASALAAAVRDGLSTVRSSHEGFGGLSECRGIPTFIDSAPSSMEMLSRRYLRGGKRRRAALISVLDGYGITWLYGAAAGCHQRLDSLPRMAPRLR